MSTVVPVKAVEFFGFTPFEHASEIGRTASLFLPRQALDISAVFKRRVILVVRTVKAFHYFVTAHSLYRDQENAHSNRNDQRNLRHHPPCHWTQYLFAARSRLHHSRTQCGHTIAGRVTRWSINILSRLKIGTQWVRESTTCHAGGPSRISLFRPGFKLYTGMVEHWGFVELCKKMLEQTPKQYYSSLRA